MVKDSESSLNCGAQETERTVVSGDVSEGTVVIKGTCSTSVKPRTVAGAVTKHMHKAGMPSPYMGTFCRSKRKSP